MEDQCAVLGSQFVQAYYSTYDSPDQKQNVINFYHQDALLTFEGDKKQGKKDIMDKLTTIQQTAVGTQHVISSLDCQPFGPDGVLIIIVGQLKTEGEDKALGYSHTFLIRQHGGSYYIFNEVFRLVLHNF